MPWTLGDLARRPPLPASPAQNRPAPYAPVDERRFEDWYDAWATANNMNRNPDDPEQFYDYRQAFAEGVTPPDVRRGEHWPSEVGKERGHPHYIVGGFNTRTGERVPGTRRGTVQELIDHGWDVEFARTHGRR